MNTETLFKHRAGQPPVRRKFAALLAFTGLLVAPGAFAANQYFSGGTVWDTTTANWGAATGGPYTSAWTSGNFAIFEGAAGTVTVDSLNNPTAGGINFSNTGYTLSGGQINLNANANITVSGGSSGNTKAATINSVIGETNGSRNVTYSSGGASASYTTLTLGGTNTFSGTCTISQTKVNFNSLAAGGTASSFGQGSNTVGVVVGNSAGYGEIDYTGSGGSTDRPFTFGGSGGGIIRNNGTGPIAFNNTGSAVTGTAGLRPITLAGSYTAGINVFAEAIADLPSLNPALTNTSLIISGGQWYLCGTNSHTGTNTIGTSSSIVVLVSNDMAFGASTAPIRFTGSCKIKSTNSSVTLSASRTISVTNTQTAKFGNCGTENLYINSYITGQGGVSKVDSSFSQGRVRFACPTNDFQGDFGIDKGNVEFTYLANQGTPSSFGVGVAANYGRITLNNANSFTDLSYVGTNNCATTRPLGWMGGGSSILLEATNTGTIAYLATDNIRLISGTAQNITLRGSNPGTNTLNQGVNDAGGATSLSKTGSGQWVLSGANTYSGNTIISGGLLTLQGGSPLGATPNVSLYGATLDVSGVTGGTLSLGAAQTMALIGNLGTTNWQSATNVGNLDISASAGLTVGYSNGIPALRVASGALTLGAAMPLSIIVSNGGTALPGGTYTLIAKNAGGAVAGAVTNTAVFSGDVSTNSTVSIAGGELVLTVPTATLYPPVLSGIGLSAGHSVLTFSGTNGQPYKVLTSTNVATPLSNWVSIASGTLTGTTLYFTNGPATNAQQFYLITSP